MRNFKTLIVSGRQLICAAFLLFMLAATTSAYSIVMRGGKRIEIPTQFTVTSVTLTYEKAPGFWITLQMAAIDIPATERANNEMPGSLLARANKDNESLTSEWTSQAVESKASRSITNRDLESFQLSRLESERAYERRLKAQGLPPLAVLRAKAAADDERFRQELARKLAESEAQEETAQLQAQIESLSAQLDSLQSRNSQLSAVTPDAFSGYGAGPFYGDVPLYGNGPFGNGPYGNGPYGNGPYGNGPYGNGPFGNGPYGNGPYGNGPYGNGPYGNGPYGNGPYGNGPYRNGPYYGNGPYGNGPYGNGPYYRNGPYGNGPYGNGPYRRNRRYYGGRWRVNPGLFQVPFGLPVGGAFGTFNVPSGVQPLQGFQHNINVAPETRPGRRGGSRSGPHGRRHSR